MPTRNSNSPLVITLTPELKRSLTEQARKQGTTPEILALDSLRERFIPGDEPAGDDGTLAEFLGEHIGVLHSGEHVPGGAHMSESCGEKFAAGLLAKHRQQDS